MTDPLTVTVSHAFSASPERVFDAWLDPVRARRFLFATPTGQNVKCEIDARVGGGFLIVDRRPAGDAEHYRTFVEIDRPRRLVFDFAMDRSMAGATRVTIEIAPAGQGCALTLTHVGVPADYLDRVNEGWSGIFAALEAVLAAS